MVHTLVSPTCTRYNGDLFERTLHIFAVCYMSMPYVRSPGIDSTDPGVGVAQTPWYMLILLQYGSIVTGSA
jgi:hypothetical protein